MISMSLGEAAAVVEGRKVGADVRFCGCSIDSRNMPQEGMFIAMQGAHNDGHDFAAAAKGSGAAAAMVERKLDDIGLPYLLVQATSQAMGRLAAHWRTGFDLPMVAVTGSNGKTTVKAMLESICCRSMEVLVSEGNFNNELGVPLTLFRLQPQHNCAVIEMGATAIGDISYLASLARPTVAVVTQCAPAHLQGFGSIEAVANTKGEIFSALPDTGVAVINIDDEWSPLWESMAQYATKLRFGMAESAEVRAEAVRFDQQGSGFTLITPMGEAAVQLALPGQHNVMNALAAAACAHALGLAPGDIAAGLSATASVAGRLHAVAGVDGSTILDDSYNANPDSLRAGLKVLQQYQQPRWLILGEMAELGDTAAMWHEQAGQYARSCGVERLLAVGELASLAARSFGVGGDSYPDRQSLLEALPPLSARPVVLVKGSRLAGMDQVVKALQR